MDSVVIRADLRLKYEQYKYSVLNNRILEIKDMVERRACYGNTSIILYMTDEFIEHQREMCPDQYIPTIDILVDHLKKVYIDSIVQRVEEGILIDWS